MFVVVAVAELAGDREAVGVVESDRVLIQLGGGLFVVEGETDFLGFDAVAENINNASGFDLFRDAFAEAIA